MYIFEIIGRVEERSADAIKIMGGNVMLYETIGAFKMPAIWFVVRVQIGLIVKEFSTQRNPRPAATCADHLH
jgi:hypothetical protein